MATTFLNGPRHDFILDRDTEFTCRLLQVADEVMTDPTCEIERSLTRRRAVDDDLIPTPTIDGVDYLCTFSEDITGALNDLASPGTRPVYLRYRFRALVDGVRRTLLCGRLVIGPIGFGTSGQSETLPLRIYIGNIIVGDTAELVVPDPPDPDTPPDPDDPPPPDPGDTLADAVEWGTDFVEAWAATVYATWE